MFSAYTAAASVPSINFRFGCTITVFDGISHSHAGLLPSLQDQNATYTVLVPTNAAFADLTQNVLNTSDIDTLRLVSSPAWRAASALIIMHQRNHAIAACYSLPAAASEAAIFTGENVTASCLLCRCCCTTSFQGSCALPT